MRNLRNRLNSPTPSSNSTLITNNSQDLKQPKPKLQPFKGENDKITIENFLRLFVNIALYYNWTDAIKVLMLGNYLQDEALNWYAEQSNFDWPTLQEDLIQRFGHPTTDPLIQLSRLKYDSKLGMKGYFEEKRRLGTLAKLNENQVISLMIEGLPANLRLHFITIKPQNYAEFYRTAKLAEEALLEQKVSKNYDFKRFENRKAPPNPCKICENLGYGKRFHWMNECKNQSNKPIPNRKPNAVNVVEDSNEESEIIDTLN